MKAGSAAGCAIVGAGLALAAACHQTPIIGPALLVEASATSLHQVGRFDADEHAMASRSGEAGILHFGPYADLPVGHYDAHFIVSSGKGGRRDGNAGSVDVNASSPEQPLHVLVTKPINFEADQSEMVLPFDAPPGAKLEFRASSNGATDIKFFRVVVKHK